jgi:hypothetical protein
MVAVVLVIVFGASCGWARADAGDLPSGLALLDEAARLRVSDPTRSERLAADAAAMIGAGLGMGLGEAGADTAVAQRALGNAWLLSGDVGRAVLAYRRAQRADPGDAMVASSLAHARSLVSAGAPVTPGPLGGWRATLDESRSLVPRKALFVAGLVLFVGGCLVMAARIVSLVGGAMTALAWTGVVSGGALLGLLAAEPLLDVSGEAVVVETAVGRTGPHAEVYPPAFDAPLPAGAEVRILESRDGWLLCSMGTTRAWLPGGSVERVRPSPRVQPTGIEPAGSGAG